MIGASANPDKYGFKVLKYLKDAGVQVFPINPKGGEILGLRAYPSVFDFPDKIDMAVFVTQPEVTEKVLQKIKEKGIQKVWLQPDSESETAIEFCKQNQIECIYNTCIMANN